MLISCSDSRYVGVVTLCASELEQCRSTIIMQLDPSDKSNTYPPYINNIRGQVLKTANRFEDPVDQVTKTFIVFHDLSIRTLGYFRLVCNVVDLKRYQCRSF